MPPKPGNAFAQLRAMEQQASQSSLQHTQDFSQGTTSSGGTVVVIPRNHPQEQSSVGAAASALAQDMPDTPRTTMAMFTEETASEEGQDISQAYTTPLSRKHARKRKKNIEAKQSTGDLQDPLAAHTTDMPAPPSPPGKQSGLDFIKSTISKGKRAFSRTTSSSVSRPGNASAPSNFEQRPSTPQQSLPSDNQTAVSDLHNTDPAVIYATASPQSNTPATSVLSAGPQRTTLPNIHVPATAAQVPTLAGIHAPRTTSQRSTARNVEPPTTTSDVSTSSMRHTPTTTSRHSAYFNTHAPTITSQQPAFSTADAPTFTAQQSAFSSIPASTVTSQRSTFSDVDIPATTSQQPATSNVDVPTATSGQSVRSDAGASTTSMQQNGFPSVRVAANRVQSSVPGALENTFQHYMPQSSIPDRYRQSTAYGHHVANLPPFQPHAGMMPYSHLVPRRHDRPRHISTATQHTYGSNQSQYASVNPNEGIILSDTSITPTRQGSYAVAGTAELVSRPNMVSMTGLVSEVPPTPPSSTRPMISDPAYITTAHGVIPATSLYNFNASEDTKSEGQKSDLEEAAEVTGDENEVQNLLRKSGLRRAFSSSNLNPKAPVFESRAASVAASAGSPPPTMPQGNSPVLAAPENSPCRSPVDNNNNNTTTYGGPTPTHPTPPTKPPPPPPSNCLSFAVLHHRLEMTTACSGSTFPGR
ncbi:hypothetical protein GJ744_002834 [Endocarpon pusillum]|uniref:Uncharacterized protein n=1 Tax=Endocarpon pusillum TaxID=364733 RepID=A0A8H7DYK7_9EURO|nr:hypothetical protein GJ744_002834 [Endocarpon pusillum]